MAILDKMRDWWTEGQLGSTSRIETGFIDILYAVVLGTGFPRFVEASIGGKLVLIFTVLLMSHSWYQVHNRARKVTQTRKWHYSNLIIQLAVLLCFSQMLVYCREPQLRNWFFYYAGVLICDTAWNAITRIDVVRKKVRFVANGPYVISSLIMLIVAISLGAAVVSEYPLASAITIAAVWVLHLVGDFVLHQRTKPRRDQASSASAASSLRDRLQELESQMEEMNRIMRDQASAGNFEELRAITGKLVRCDKSVREKLINYLDEMASTIEKY